MFLNWTAEGVKSQDQSQTIRSPKQENQRNTDNVAIQEDLLPSGLREVSLAHGGGPVTEFGLGWPQRRPGTLADWPLEALSRHSLYTYTADVNSVRENEVSPRTVPGTQRN